MLSVQLSGTNTRGRWFAILESISKSLWKLQTERTTVYSVDCEELEECTATGDLSHKHISLHCDNSSRLDLGHWDNEQKNI